MDKKLLDKTYKGKTKDELLVRIGELERELHATKIELGRLKAKHENIIGYGGVRNETVK